MNYLSKNKWYIVNLIVIGCLLSSCYYDNREELYQYVQQQECNLQGASFASDIVPVLNQYCTRCHREGRKDGDVNLQGYNNVQTYVNDGSLYGTTNHEVGYSTMPTSGVKIPFCDIEKMRLWIQDGALNN